VGFIAEGIRNTVTFLVGLFTSFLGLLLGYRPNRIARLKNGRRGWWSS
jgi:hypothetical protein